MSDEIAVWSTETRIAAGIIAALLMLAFIAQHMYRDQIADVIVNRISPRLSVTGTIIAAFAVWMTPAAVLWGAMLGTLSVATNHPAAVAMREGLACGGFYLLGGAVVLGFVLFRERWGGR